MSEAEGATDTQEAQQTTTQEKEQSGRGRVTVFPNWCKGCHLCIEFCPEGVLAEGPGGRVIVAHPERCIACRWCELHCPDFAIFVTQLKDEDKEDE